MKFLFSVIFFFVRSRVKQQGERKLQKVNWKVTTLKMNEQCYMVQAQEFFERKRMASKVQRIKPSLSKVKAAVSQDLLFLRATTPAAKRTRKGEFHCQLCCFEAEVALKRSRGNKAVVVPFDLNGE